MGPPNTLQSTWDLVLADEEATQRLANDLSAALTPGDLVTLSGDLGAGKTTFARAVIRALAGDDQIEVPSPTFTFLQLYELPRFPVVHADLYRVTTLAELAELGWEEASEGAAVMVEWPDRAAVLIHADRLDVALALAPDLGPTFRRVQLTGYGIWANRLARMRAARTLIDATGFAQARRVHLVGDASTRRYERLYIDGASAILMDAAPRPDGPPVRGGRPYSALAHLAENVRPFVALARGLRERGFSAPLVQSADLETGLLLLEDLGDERLIHGDPPVPVEERYEAAVDLLVALHSLELPASLPVAPRLEHKLPPYDMSAFLIEAELLLDWYMPYRGARLLTLGERETFLTLWQQALADMLSAPQTWVLRDFHSPNLLWLHEREGIERVGVLDFQDALIGPAAYDVASLLMDARADVSQDLELRLLSRYAAGRTAAVPDFELKPFVRQYVTLGAQRATKILGIFARLNRRDGKPEYLRHLPRVWGYLARALAHPSLVDLARWYAAHVPPPIAVPAAPATYSAA
jgi:tRNA threonylcarbamoyl adenosine modification protein YjeE